MLNNKQIAGKFDLLAKLMELHDENPFKIKSYANAYLSLRKLEGNLAEMPLNDLASIPGVGVAIADKIKELIATGEMDALKKYQQITPLGIQEMLSIKGLGPKKVKQIWKEMDITTVGELLYACNENRLVAYKGFGIKVQEEIRQKTEYFLDSTGKYLYAHIHEVADELFENFKKAYPFQNISLCGDVRRCMPEVCGIELITDMIPENLDFTAVKCIFEDDQLLYKGFPVYIYFTGTERFHHELFKRSCSETFLTAFDESQLNAIDEDQIFGQLGIHFIPAESREYADIVNQYRNNVPVLIGTDDIKGIIHNHSTYSDGLHTLGEMSRYVYQSGYEYFVISDHSKSAGYAGGLKEEQVFAQWKEIDALNVQFGESFRIFKGIESDILIDGSLDYSDDILSQFDLVIASVHSVLNMDEDKATARLIKAIENPYTRILGHPTGRLLLARPGYPLNFKKIIDACASNQVVIELNANPQRLDIDWKWIPYCMEKEVMIAINPDAHSKESIHYIRYGTTVARKGGLTPEMCLNTKSLSEFSSWLAR
jgi:DNA polymerase (family X)